MEQAQATQETKSVLSSDEARKKSTNATRIAAPRSTRKQTSSRLKASAAKPASAAGAAGQAPPSEVTVREKIALLAYFYWEARGRQGGSKEEQDDWLRAEREVLSSLAANEQ
jgi:hypothetical protein